MKSSPGIYWTSTILLCGFMVFAAFNYLADAPMVRESFRSLGYPEYFPVLLGLAKFGGALVLLVPGVAMWKEWAYAGFTFTFVGAMASHLFAEEFGAMLSPLLALALLVVSYSFRPASRRVLSCEAVQEVDENGHVRTVFRTTPAH
jgi:hypothetical protein